MVVAETIRENLAPERATGLLVQDRFLLQALLHLKTGRTGLVGLGHEHAKGIRLFRSLQRREKRTAFAQDEG